MPPPPSARVGPSSAAGRVVPQRSDVPTRRCALTQALSWRKSQRRSDRPAECCRSGGEPTSGCRDGRRRYCARASTGHRRESCVAGRWRGASYAWPKPRTAMGMRDEEARSVSRARGRRAKPVALFSTPLTCPLTRRAPRLFANADWLWPADTARLPRPRTGGPRRRGQRCADVPDRPPKPHCAGAKRRAGSRKRRSDRAPTQPTGGRGPGRAGCRGGPRRVGQWRPSRVPTSFVRRLPHSWAVRREAILGRALEPGERGRARRCARW
jgi:hypothetical protein